MDINSYNHRHILFIAHDALLYGPGKSLLVLIEGLLKKEYSVYVVSPCEGPLTIEFKKRNIPYSIIRFHWWISGRFEKKHPFTSDYIRRLYYRFVKPFYNLFIALPKFEQIITKNNIDLVVNNSMVTPMGILIKYKYKINTILYIRESIDDIGLDLPYYVAQKIIQKANGLIYVSSYIRSRYPKIKSQHQVIIYDSLDYDQLNQQISARTSIRKFLMVGRISPQKGHLQAIQAIALLRNKYPDIQLIIVGTGNTDMLDEYIKKHQLQSNIIFVGWSDKPKEYYQTCDCSIICSENEAFGKVIIESMAYGCPVIGKNVASIKELITDGDNGFLYEGDYMKLAVKMEELILSPKKVIEIAYRAYEYVNKNFAPEKTINSFEQFI